MELIRAMTYICYITYITLHPSKKTKNALWIDENRVENKVTVGIKLKQRGEMNKDGVNFRFDGIFPIPEG